MPKPKNPKPKTEEEIQKEVLPDPKKIELESDIDLEVINPTAIRRGKVRELMKMGYGNADIHKILQKGVTLKDGRFVDTAVSAQTISYDMDYVRQDILSAQSQDMLQRRAEIIDRLEFLYQRAVAEYGNKGTSSQAKNSFLSTALSIMGKLIEVEGVKSPDNLRLSVSSDDKMKEAATKINTLSDDERKSILSTIRKVITERKSGGSGESVVSD